MQRNRSKILAPAFALLLLAGLGCGTIGLPGGGGTPAPPPVEEDVITGEVARVDTSKRQIEIDDRGRRHVAGYDGGTRVLYEGRDYRPEDLERGDVVRVRVDESRYGDLYAERVDVVESVRARGDDPYDRPRDDRYGDVTGEVSAVDTTRREIRVDTAQGVRTVEYGTRTPVYYRGETYRPENLEPGDEVRVTVSDRGLAESIQVTRSVQERTGEVGRDPSGDDRSGEDRYGADRLTGTVEWIDQRRGQFGLRTEARELVTVEVPFDARGPVRDQFAALDRGDYVRIEAEDVERGRVELVRFL